MDVDLNVAVEHARVLHQQEIARDVNRNSDFFDFFQVAGISAGADDDQLRHVGLIGGGDGDGQVLDHHALLHAEADPMRARRPVALPISLARAVGDFVDVRFVRRRFDGGKTFRDQF